MGRLHSFISTTTEQPNDFDISQVSTLSLVGVCLGIIVTLLLAVGAVFIMLYCRRRVSNNDDSGTCCHLKWSKHDESDVPTTDLPYRHLDESATYHNESPPSYQQSCQTTCTYNNRSNTPGSQLCADENRNPSTETMSAGGGLNNQTENNSSQSEGCDNQRDSTPPSYADLPVALPHPVGIHNSDSSCSLGGILIRVPPPPYSC